MNKQLKVVYCIHYFLTSPLPRFKGRGIAKIPFASRRGILGNVLIDYIYFFCLSFNLR
jgi:hypothetical protein